VRALSISETALAHSEELRTLPLEPREHVLIVDTRAVNSQRTLRTSFLPCFSLAAERRPANPPSPVSLLLSGVEWDVIAPSPNAAVGFYRRVLCASSGRVIGVERHMNAESRVTTGWYGREGWGSTVEQASAAARSRRGGGTKFPLTTDVYGAPALPPDASREFIVCGRCGCAADLLSQHGAVASFHFGAGLSAWESRAEGDEENDDEEEEEEEENGEDPNSGDARKRSRRLKRRRPATNRDKEAAISRVRVWCSMCGGAGELVL
jgi:hypothetical protein